MIDPFFGSLISAGLGFGSSLLGSSSSAKGASEANAANLQIAREQMAFQRESAQNRILWTVEDAKRAGVNPMYAIGAPAPTQMGASATMVNTRPNRGELMLASAKAIADIMLTREMAETQDKEQDLKDAERNLITGGRIPFVNYPLDRFGSDLRAGVGSASQLARDMGSTVRDMFTGKHKWSWNPARRN